MTTEVLDAPAQAVTPAPTLSAVKVYNPIEQGIALLMEKHGAVLTTPPDVSTPKLLEAAKKNRQELVKFRTRVEATRKEEKAASLAYGQLVDSEAKRITAVAAPIEAAYTNAITAEEERLAEIERQAVERERQRKGALQARVDDIRGTVGKVAGQPVQTLETVIAELMSLPVDESFQEYQTAAAEAKAQALVQLEQMVAGARELERQRRELEQQRAEAARVDAIKAKMAETKDLLTTAAMARAAARILPLIERSKAVVIDDTYAEFREQATQELADVQAGLQGLYDTKVEQGKRAAELERVQQEQAQRQRDLDEQARLQAAAIKPTEPAPEPGPVAAALATTPDAVAPTPSDAAQEQWCCEVGKATNQQVCDQCEVVSSSHQADMAPVRSETQRPSDQEIVRAVAAAFGTTYLTALTWLEGLDFHELNR